MIPIVCLTESPIYSWLYIELKKKKCCKKYKRAKACKRCPKLGCPVLKIENTIN